MVGVDIIEIARIKAAIKKYGDRFITKIFTKYEINYCKQHKNPYPRYAARFAAKEAVAKIIKEGPRNYWQEIEIQSLPSGAPIVVLSKRIQLIFKHDIEISLSHNDTQAIAFAMQKQESPK